MLMKLCLIMKIITKQNMYYTSVKTGFNKITINMWSLKKHPCVCGCRSMHYIFSIYSSPKMCYIKPHKCINFPALENVKLIGIYLFKNKQKIFKTFPPKNIIFKNTKIIDTLFIIGQKIFGHSIVTSLSITV